MISMVSMTFLGRIDVVEKSGSPERSFVSLHLQFSHPNGL